MCTWSAKKKADLHTHSLRIEGQRIRTSLGGRSGWTGAFLSWMLGSWRCHLRPQKGWLTPWQHGLGSSLSKNASMFIFVHPWVIHAVLWMFLSCLERGRPTFLQQGLCSTLKEHAYMLIFVHPFVKGPFCEGIFHGLVAQAWVIARMSQCTSLCTLDTSIHSEENEPLWVHMYRFMMSWKRSALVSYAWYHLVMGR